MNYTDRFIYISKLYRKSDGLFPKTLFTLVIYLLFILIGFMAQAKPDLCSPKGKVHSIVEYTQGKQKTVSEVSYLPNGSNILLLHSSNNKAFIHKMIKQ